MLDTIRTAVTLPYDGHTDPDSLYVGEVPNIPFNSVAVALFAIVTIYQCFAGIYYRSWWVFVTVTLFALGQFIGYIGRVLSSSDLTGGSLRNINYFLLQFCSLVISANLINAAIYYQHSKLIVLYGKKFSKKFDAMTISVVFMVSDLICLVIQAIGGGLCGIALADHSSMKNGQDIFIAGLAIQVFSMAAFQLLFFRLNYFIFIKTRIQYLKIYQQELQITDADIARYSNWKHWYSLIKFIPSTNLEMFYDEKHAPIRMRNDKYKWKLHWYPLAIWAAFACAFVRCIYRLIELADGGFKGYLIRHEYFLVFLDFFPLIIASILISIFHPGAALLSKNYELPVKKISFKKKSKKTNQEAEEETAEEDLEKDHEDFTQQIDGPEQEDIEKTNRGSPYEFAEQNNDDHIASGKIINNNSDRENDIDDVLTHCSTNYKR